MSILYLSPYGDGTGYAHAANNTILGLDAAGVEILPKETKLASQNVNPSARVIQLESADADPSAIDTIVHHILPPAFVACPFKRNIGYFHVETTHFRPSNWQFYANLMDEIWVCSEQNKDACEQSGVNVPVKVIPIPADLSTYEKKHEKLDLPILRGKYVFYSISDWSERKNLKSVIKAYLTEFSRRDDVVLLIKCYADGHSSEQSKQLISNEINEIKKSLRKGVSADAFPPIVMFNAYLADEDINRLHATGDCFVSGERAAAWNIAAFDAFAFGKVVLCNGWGGQTQFLRPEQDTGVDLFDYRMTPVEGMTLCPYHNMYTCYEEWADPFIDNIMESMRFAYEGNYKVTDSRKTILEEYSLQNAGQKIKDVL